MNCDYCGGELSGRQERFCNKNCNRKWFYYNRELLDRRQRQRRLENEVITEPNWLKCNRCGYVATGMHDLAEHKREHGGIYYEERSATRSSLTW